MKILHIVRHGKALQDYNSISDIDRPLVEKGIVKSIMMAKRVKDTYPIPDLIISSPAARALHTAHIFARIFGYSSANVLVEDALYMNGEDIILNFLEGLSDEIGSVALVAHNPDLSYLSGLFLPSVTCLPTSGVVSLRLETEHWSTIRNAVASGNQMI